MSLPDLLFFIIFAILTGVLRERWLESVLRDSQEDQKPVPVPLRKVSWSRRVNQRR